MRARSNKECNPKDSREARLQARRNDKEAKPQRSQRAHRKELGTIRFRCDLCTTTSKNLVVLRKKQRRREATRSTKDTKEELLVSCEFCAFLRQKFFAFIGCGFAALYYYSAESCFLSKIFRRSQRIHNCKLQIANRKLKIGLRAKPAP